MANARRFTVNRAAIMANRDRFTVICPEFTETRGRFTVNRAAITANRGWFTVICPEIMVGGRKRSEIWHGFCSSPEEGCPLER